MGKRGWPVFLFAALAASGAMARGPSSARDRIDLRGGWTVQSSANVVASGQAISIASFDPSGWYPTAVPSTVLAALVANKAYPDPYFGMNLRSIPGTTYPIGANFSNLEMPEDSPFKPSWWYRTAFRLPLAWHRKNVWLHFGGINYRANIWLNGKKIAGTGEVVGMWRTYEFNVTHVAEAGKNNALAVEVFAPHADDLGITWVDWNPAPPDKDMGLWRSVYITSTGPVEIRYPQVITHFDLPSLSVAHVTISADLVNATDRAVNGTLAGRIETIEFSQPLSLGPHETKTVTFTPGRFHALNVAHPRVWWPTELGAQNLYELELSFKAGGKLSDRTAVTFAMREITSHFTAQGYRLFQINGKNILIRGGGWAPDMMLRYDSERLEEEIKYTKDMHLNTLRLEGKIDSDKFFDLCDRYGILVLAGWCCCDHWEKWATWKPEDYRVAEESLRSQLRRLRNHACMLDWLYGSDNPPPPRVEKIYLRVLKECRWPNPYQSSASAKPTTVTGSPGVKMTGPYNYVPPLYWLADRQHGGAFGFNTETSPGPAIPPVASLKEMLPAEHLWPFDKFWDYHAGGGEFKNLNVFTEAMNARYGAATGLGDYVEKAQVMAYEGERAMFEAFGAHKYVSTGVIQWMLNNAWPSLIWHLFDYYLRPGGGYFGAKKACEPLHVQYSYDDGSVIIVNSLYRAYSGLEVKASVYNFDMKEKFSRESKIAVAPDSSTKVFTIPELAGLSPTYFLRLGMKDSAGNVVSRNFYWLSRKPVVLDWAKSTWWYTPATSYGDMTALQSLPKVRLKFSSTTEVREDENVTRVVVENPSPNLAFFVRLRVLKGNSGDEVLPILWQDSYFSLLPGEKRMVSAAYKTSALGGVIPYVVIDGWNVTPDKTGSEREQ